MNELYHGLKIGFNWWYVVLPALMLVLGIVGSFRYYSDSNGKIWRKNKKFTFFLKVLAVVADAVVIAMILLESFAGLLQVLLNVLLPQDDPFWAIIVMAICLTMMAFFGYAIMALSINMGSKIKIAHLKRQQRYNSPG